MLSGNMKDLEIKRKMLKILKSALNQINSKLEFIEEKMSGFKAKAILSKMECRKNNIE